MNRFKNIIILIVGVVLVNILAQRFYTTWDLTEDQRYTLSDEVKNYIEKLDTSVLIRVYMTADFLPADYKLFKQNIKEKLEDFRHENIHVHYVFEDPNQGEPELVRSRGMALRRMGVRPVRVGKDQQGKDVYVFPAVVVEGRDTVLVNLMDNEVPGADEQRVIANSISLLEYNLARGIHQATNQEPRIVAFLEGRGELEVGQVRDLDRSLRMKGYAVGRLPIDAAKKVGVIDPKIDLLIIAKPREKYSAEDKFLIDQYIMHGGKTMWLIDRLSADLDSMVVRKRYTPWDYPLEIEDMLFKYGIRIQPNLIMDLESAQVKLVDGTLGNAAQMNTYPWYFHPVVRPFSDNPIVKNLDRVHLRFASVIDTIATKKSNTKKTVLLRTSDKTMLKYSPVDLNFEFLREKPVVEMFKEKNLPVAVLLEGEFLSNFEYTATKAMKEMIARKGQKALARSTDTKMLVVSDGDIAKNDYDPNTGKIRALGFDKVSGYRFANKDFLMNAIEYMVDDIGIIQSKNREIKMNVLDCNRAKEEKNKWQIVNIVLPLLFLLVFGIAYYWFRKRRFAK